jgi:hypothetical protein
MPLPEDEKSVATAGREEISLTEGIRMLNVFLSE